MLLALVRSCNLKVRLNVRCVELSNSALLLFQQEEKASSPPRAVQQDLG